MISILLTSSIASSQNVTDSVVILPKRIAIEVAKDLERLDLADSLLLITEKKMENMARELGMQDRIIAGQQSQIEGLNEIIENNGEQLATKDKETKYWEKQYKKQKRQKFTVAGIALVIIGLLAVR